MPVARLHANIVFWVNPYLCLCIKDLCSFRACGFADVLSCIDQYCEDVAMKNRPLQVRLLLLRGTRIFIEVILTRTPTARMSDMASILLHSQNAQRIQSARNQVSSVSLLFAELHSILYAIFSSACTCSGILKIHA